jgi:hypothetical protein
VNRILVTGARAPVALDLARAFRAAGVVVHLADSLTPWAAKALRPGFPLHRLPPPRQSFAAFRPALAKLVAEQRIDLVVPTCEEVFWIAAAAGRDGYAPQVFAPPLAVLRRLHSKIEFGALARALGIPVPDSWTLTSADDLGRVPVDLQHLVLKPEFSRFASRTLIRPAPSRAASIRPTPTARWVAQRFVAGQEVCCWSAARAGSVVALAVYRPRWRHGQAAAFGFEAIDLPAAADIARRVARALGMTGHLSFDMIVTPDGAVLPIECNPRAVSGLHLFDSDAALARALLGAGSVPAPPVGRLRHLSPAMAVLGVPQALRRGRLAGLIRDWRAGEDAIGRPGDRLPVLGSLLDAARFAVAAMKQRQGAAAATTADIEWDGEPIP